MARRFIPRGIVAAGLMALVSAAGAPSAPAAEGPTPQALDANAEFLAYAPPPPPVPAKVCVVDTGVDLTTDAAPAVIERHSVFGGTVDDVGGSGLAKHGTLVAGVIASQPDGRDSVGIWPRAQIVSVRVFSGPGGRTTAAAVITAFEKWREFGALVVNLSLSGLDQATAEELARLDNRIAALRLGRGVSVVAGAGNNGGAVGYPARFASVIAVGATDSSGALCAFSSRGVELDVSAMGCGVEVSWLGGGVGVGNGTSYSTPIATAILAALRAYRPDLDATSAEHLLMSTADAGRVNAERAFRAAGLDELLETPQPPALAPRSGEPRQATSRVTDPLRELGVQAPRVRVATFRQGLLDIRVAGVPDFGRAVFMVDGRRHVRSSGRLRARLRRAPRRVSVVTEIPGVGHTPRTVVRVRITLRSARREMQALKDQR